jgi:hypothetical protein
VAFSCSEVLKFIRQDVTDVTREIWSSLKLSIGMISNSLTIINIIELIITGLFLICVPNIVVFIVKTMMKLGKV